MTAMTVNGRPIRFELDPQTPLLWALRDAANLTGTKYGCGVGDCGACMVLIDGEALRSCLVTIAEAEGREIVTIEGLSYDRSHPVQQALVAEQAIQCGFCTPGIAMAAAALIRNNPSPGEEEIAQAITLEHGKPLAQARLEVIRGAEFFEWDAAEAMFHERHASDERWEMLEASDAYNRRANDVRIEAKAICEAAGNW